MESLEYEIIGEFLADLKEFEGGDDKTIKVVELKKIEQGNRIIERNEQNDQKKAYGDEKTFKKLKERREIRALAQKINTPITVNKTQGQQLSQFQVQPKKARSSVVGTDRAYSNRGSGENKHNCHKLESTGKVYAKT